MVPNLIIELHERKPFRMTTLVRCHSHFFQWAVLGVGEHTSIARNWLAYSLEKLYQIIFCYELAETRNVNLPIVGIRSLFLAFRIRNKDVQCEIISHLGPVKN